MSGGITAACPSGSLLKDKYKNTKPGSYYTVHYPLNMHVKFLIPQSYKKCLVLKPLSGPEADFGIIQWTFGGLS